MSVISPTLISAYNIDKQLSIIEEEWVKLAEPYIEYCTGAPPNNSPSMGVDAFIVAYNFIKFYEYPPNQLALKYIEGRKEFFLNDVLDILANENGFLYGYNGVTTEMKDFMFKEVLRIQKIIEVV